MMRRVAVLAAALLFTGCANFPDAPSRVATPRIDGEAVVSVDEARLALSRWDAPNERAVVIAVHGMNDYAGAFALAGPVWTERGVTTYAYDQRGFGRSPDKGRWAGSKALRQDLRAVIEAVRARHPDRSIFLLGHSMGAAVVMSTVAEDAAGIDGVVLAAPGVWGGSRMPILYRLTLNLAASVMPGKTLTGERAGRQASDNIEFLRAMYRDPHVIKDTRIDAVLGAVRMMGEGWKAADDITAPTLFIYGAKDDIIPVKAMRKAGERLGAKGRVVVYPDGWHLLLADLGRERPITDIADWILAQVAAREEFAQTGD
jgi:alpha-beta hydrolase superfamily lysophospholipase